MWLANIIDAFRRPGGWRGPAVAAVFTLLAGLPEVDAQRVGVTGISWGGYLTCIVAGVALQSFCFKCLFLIEGEVWTGVEALNDLVLLI